ncbi:MAG: hypothetical protein U0269_30730 [Polyangiales bacterium]
MKRLLLWVFGLAVLAAIQACSSFSMHDGYRWAIAGAGVAAGALRDAARAEGEAALAGASSRDEALRRIESVRARWTEVAASARNTSRSMQSLGAMNEQLDALVERKFPRPTTSPTTSTDAGGAR